MVERKSRYTKRRAVSAKGGPASGWDCQEIASSLPGSSAVEQLTVNQLVVGSNPTPGAREAIFLS